MEYQRPSTPTEEVNSLPTFSIKWVNYWLVIISEQQLTTRSKCNGWMSSSTSSTSNLSQHSRHKTQLTPGQNSWPLFCFEFVQPPRKISGAHQPNSFRNDAEATRTLNIKPKSQISYIPKDLATNQPQVFTRVDASKPPLHPPFEDTYEVQERHHKYFAIERIFCENIGHSQV